MIDLHYAPTPNGWKISIMLEECGLPYQRHSGQHRRRRAVQAGVPRDQPQQPDSGDRRSRAGRRRRAVLGVRDRRDPDLSRRQDRPVPAEGDARRGSSVMQWLMWQMGGLGPDARPERPLRALCAGEDPLRDRALPRRGEAALRRARHAARQDRRLRRRRLFDRRHGVLSLDHDPQGARLYARRFPERQALVRRGARAAAGAGGTCARQVREGADGRGGAQDHVRRACQGAWRGRR